MKRWGLFLFYGWAILTFGLFLAITVGKVVTWQFALGENGVDIVQAIAMSLIVIPITLYLYKKLLQQTNKSKKTAHSFSQPPQILTGLLFAVGLAFVSLFVMDTLDWITLEEWHSPLTWISALALNLCIAFFYEALPEEIVMRGFIYDVLRQKLSTWTSVLIQAVIFLAFSASNSLLLMLAGMIPTTSIVTLPSELILHFFFAVALALMRVWRGSLWASAGFHLGYLMMARFLLAPNLREVPPITTFQDNIMQGMGAMYSIMIMILGTIVMLLILIGINHKRYNI